MRFKGLSCMEMRVNPALSGVAKNLRTFVDTRALVGVR